jgi:putative Holliday junction resolvase
MPAPIGRVLGVDLGLARTGLAISDELGLSARALDNLTPKSRAEDVAFLVALCTSEDVREVVIGLASLKSGDDSMMARRARGFAEALQAALVTAARPTRVHLRDEAHSSQAAVKRLIDSGTKKSARKAALDSEVARGLVLDFVAELRASSAR